jgi:beta-lactamase regulating signal transducer with metallopeptidase domain
MYELVIIILLTILFTSFAFIFSNKMIKILRITHPKNRFWIYIIALVTAFSIFSISFIAIGSSINNDFKDNHLVIESEKEYYSVVMIVEETDIEDHDFSQIDNRNSLHNLEDKSSNNVKNLYLSPKHKIIAIFSEFSDNLYDRFSQIFPEYYDNPSYIVNSAIPAEEDITTSTIAYNIAHEDSAYQIDESLSFFTMLNLFLLIICGLYLIFSLFFARRFILKRYNAKECQNSELLHMVKELSQELKIKKIKVFIYDGDPNAFVFGFPASLVISKELIHCLSKKELGMAIRHELAHIKNRDIIIKPILQSIRILFFYNPIVHLIYYKIIRERELMADTLFINSKDEKVTLLEALLKIHESSKKQRLISHKIYSSYSLSLLSHNSRKLEITDRFNHLFGKNVKKSFFSVIICLMILTLNVSALAVAKNVLDTSYQVNEERIITEENLIYEKHNNSHLAKYFYGVFQDRHPNFCRSYIIYSLLFEIQKGDITSTDIVNSVKCLLKD